MVETGLNLSYFVEKIQNILNKAHKEEPKKKIVIYPNSEKPERINFACPVCGDSSKSVYKKRGNLYLDTLRYICFNCDTKISFTSVCSKFDENIELEDKLKIYEYIDSQSFNKKNFDNSLVSLDKLIDFDQWVNFINTHKNSMLRDLKPIENNSNAHKYLTNRKIYNYENIYQGIYQKFREGKIVYVTDVIVLLNKGKNKLLGIQLRNLEEDRNKRFYKIVDFEELYNMMNPNNPLDAVDAISYNKLSHFYNILNVNFEETITIFEGFIDSLFFNNSIGLVGANNDKDILKFLLNADDKLKLQFFYDNDDTGLKKSKQMLDNQSVFLWKKFIEYVSDNSNDPYKTKKMFDNITDLNKFVRDFNCSNPYDKYKLNDFFSKDEFDKIYL